MVVPIHWWKLDETSGPLADSGTPGGSPGTATGTTSVPGLYTRARSFAAGDVVDCGNPTNLNFGGDSFAIGAWIYRSSVPSGNVFYTSKDASGARSYGFGVGSDSKLFAFLNSDSDVLTSAYVPFPLTWGVLHFVVLTRFGTTYKFYVDGILVLTFTGPATLKTVTTPFVIGNNGHGYSSYNWGGIVDNVMVWNRDLTAYEVQDYYYRGTSAMFLSNLTPDVYATRINNTTSVAFSIECSIDIDSDFTVEVDENGTNNWVTAYNGSGWVFPYSGTVTGSTTKIDVVISSRTYPVNSPVHVRVVARNVEEEEYTLIYWFHTVTVTDQITPRYPVAGEQLVSTGENLAIDFRDPGEDPTTITVNGTLVYDASLIPVFRNSWTGSYIDDAEGQRIILIPPAPLTIDTKYTVVVNTATATKTYAFRVGSQQITTSNDAEMPRITEATSSAVWIGYIRNGKLYLRKGDPVTAEILVIPTGQFEQGYDPTLGKYILYWVDRGKIYYATADPGDAPEALVQPNDANAEVRMGLGSDKAAFLGDHDEVLQAPHVRGAPPDADLDVDIYRPTGDPEASQVVGFAVYKFIAGTFQKIAEIPIAAGETIATFTDPTFTPGAEYAAIPIYSVGGRRVEGPMSPRVAPPDYSGLIKLGIGSDMGPSVPSSQYVKSQSYPPQAYFFPDTVGLSLGSDSGPRLTYTIFTIFSFFTQETVAIGLGSDLPGTLKGTGFGIIGVG